MSLSSHPIGSLVVGSILYVEMLRPVTRVPPAINRAAQYEDAIIKQLITLSFEN